MKRSQAVRAVVTAAAILLTILLYFGSYWAFSRKSEQGDPFGPIRYFSSRRTGTFFQPAAKAESLVTGETVSVEWEPNDECVLGCPP